MDVLAKFVQLLKLPVAVILGVFAAAAFLHFAPDWLVTYLGLSEFKASNGSFFGITVLLVIAAAVWKLIDALWDAWAVKIFFGQRRNISASFHAMKSNSCWIYWPPNKIT